MKTIKLMSMLLASLVLGACSSSDSNSDDNGNGKGNGNNPAYTETILNVPPTWQIDWSYNQERPSWTEPDATLYENWTILKVLIEDELKPYTSEGDMMALFVNGELRGMATPAVIVGSNQVENGKFVMKAWGNETGAETVNISLQYYSQTLKHIFTLSDVIKFSSDLDTGIESDYIPAFTSGSAKYPVMKTSHCGEYPGKGRHHTRSGQCSVCLCGRGMPWYGDALSLWKHVTDHLRQYPGRVGDPEIL